MTVLDVFAAIVLLVLLASVVAVLGLLGWLPGKIARDRRHPYAQAVSVAGWIGLIFIVLWPLALIWAYVDLPRAPRATADLEDLRRRIAALEKGTSMQEAAE